MSVRKAVTLREVAERAEVSRTTASYILNDRATEMRIAPKTVSRVLRAVADLGYRPNRSARTLRTSRTHTIGVVSDHVAGGHYSSAMLTGASAAAHRSGHLVVIGESAGDPDIEAQLVEDMLDREVDGIVYVRTVTAKVALPEALRDQRVVLLNCVDGSAAIPALVPDEHAGGRAAAEVLLAAGVTTDIWVVGKDPTPGAIAGPLRLAGITQRLIEVGHPLAGVLPCQWTVGDAYDAVHAWLMSGVRPRGLICLNDRIAMGVYQALSMYGLDVPAEVSVVSFDGSELATWLRPPLTTIGLPFVQLGERAVEALLNHDPLAPGIHRVGMPLIEGGSVRSHLPERESTPGSASALSLRGRR